MSHARRQAGMSLIELMIAVAIGLALLAGLSSLYVSTSKARAEFNKTSEQVENGRFALQSITRDIEMAGFYGRAGQPLTTSSYVLPDPCAAAPASMGFSTSPTLTFPLPVYGPSLATTVLPCLATALPNMRTGAEVLTVSYASGSVTATPSGTEYYLQRSGCETDTVSMVYSDTASAFTLHNKAAVAGGTCSTSTTAELRKYVERSYYVATCDVCSGAGADTTPTLKMAEFVNGAINVSSLVTGIEDVHYSYGVDLDNNGSPDCYVGNPSDTTAVPAACATAVTAAAYPWTASATANWANVTAVRVNLLSRNLDNTASWTDTRTYDLGRTAVNGPYGDHYKRHVYATAARIWNTGGQRENQ
ncbi:pilus assembly protein PilW [Rhodanobacter thiooxydans]|uniref:Pilus assembly protein PilW n=2 Tax=Rhodanobacter thiooxydans TaxID=416169 RepID=A0A154QDK6_9GAMM|nr:PilW family protein [Rhodanobacter thiooxydans]EIL96732.1 type IV fimbrial biogenesis pilW-related transmembrane protein [Rhodanobacter thiooxydans LCS2]KZC22329.1 pilus assembly protein PilW [Rhodanobacter thiooxydans]MCW0202844.1 PilW family protein [Rhodanobacter thiooxydans]